MYPFPQVTEACAKAQECVDSCTTEFDDEGRKSFYFTLTRLDLYKVKIVEAYASSPRARTE